MFLETIGSGSQINHNYCLYYLSKAKATPLIKVENTLLKLTIRLLTKVLSVLAKFQLISESL